MLSALNTAISSLQKAAHSETAVYQAFGAQLQSLGLHGAISLLNEARTHFIVKALVMPESLTKFLWATEKLLGGTVGYTYPSETAVIDRQVVETGEGIYLPDNQIKLEQVFPRAGFLGRQALRGFSGMPAVVVPISLVGEAAGVLYVAGSVLQPEDVPVLTTFAQQISLALQDAHLFEALQQSEEKYRRLFEMANEAIFVVDVASLRILSVNPKTMLLTGFSESELLTKTIDELMPDATRSAVFDFVQSMEELSVVAETTLISADDQTLIVQVSATIFYLNGRLLLHGLVQDITEKQRSKQLQTAVYQIATLANSDISLDDLYRSIHEIVSQFLDARNFYIALYDAADELVLLPYFIDEQDSYDGRPYPAGNGLTEYVIRSGQPHLISAQRHAELIRQGVVDEVGPRAQIWLGAPLKTKDQTFGAIVVQNYQDATVYTEQEKEFLVFASGQIATAIERKRAELKLTTLAAELEQQVHMMDVVLSTTPDLFMIHDLDGRIRYASPSMTEILNQPLEEVIGKTLVELNAPETVIDAFYQSFDEARLVGQTIGGEVQVQMGEETRYFEFYLYPVCNPDGRVTTIVSTARDYTVRKQTEDALHHTQKMESLGVMAGGVAHDFNNLLVAIMGQTSLALAKMHTTDPAYLHIEKAVRATERAADLTQQLLAYSGRGQFAFQPLQLDTIIRENQHLLEVVIPPTVQLKAALKDDLPHIEADPGQIQQVVMNLILNAAEALEGQSGTISVCTAVKTLTAVEAVSWQRTKHSLKPGDYVSLTVSDDGCGMSEETLNRIFDPFFTTKFTGRGLGLAAVLGIIRSHKGGLRVTSQLNQGTTFELLFPVSKSAVSVTPDNSPEEDPPTAVILVIDDEAPVREAIKDILEMEKMQTLLAVDGRSGLQLYQQHIDTIDLVILDWFMPGLNGAQTLKALQQINPQVHVLISSGYSESETTDNLVASDQIRFLQKPYTLSRLIEEIRRCLA
ncbi:MAG: PAS domain S-box protein [Anaerolineales bacterium]|nr:PAS domain S-box protein [Anaerolineales bacterium]